MTHRLHLCLALILAGASPARVDLASASDALLHGRMADATAQLQHLLTANPADARAHLLLCRADYAQELADEAIEQCQLAASAAPGDSDAQLWLGRALGLKARHANPVTAYQLAKRVRGAFEQAVQLDPANVRAASDLGEFYVGAPAFLGGGLDRATALAAQLRQRSPVRAHRLLAQVAEARGDYANAEREFKAAVAETHSAESLADLADFYQRRRQYDLTVDTVRQALAADRSRGPVFVDCASILISAHRAPELAERALRDYLDSPAQTDAAPAFKARYLLGQLLAQRGDHAQAKSQYQAALNLAPDWQPARKALDRA